MKMWYEGFVGLIGLVLAYIAANVLGVEHPAYIFSFGFAAGYFSSGIVKILGNKADNNQNAGEQTRPA